MRPSVAQRPLALRRTVSFVLAAFCLLAGSGAALAQPPATAAAADPFAPPPKPMPAKPPPYSLPWQLRPVAPGNVVRLDTSYGLYANPKTDTRGSALATSVLGSYKIGPDFALIGRVGLVTNSPPDALAPAPNPPSGTNFLNPVLAGLYGIKLSPRFKLGLFLGLALPVGSGGGDTPDPAKAAANGVGVYVRSAFDNAMFAVNYFTVFPGLDVAYVHGGLTVQAEATLLKLTKVRGPDSADHTNTNFTTGVHVGYFVLPMLSVGVELRHQRWLSTPNAVEARRLPRDNTTVAFGPRLHLELADKIWFRPGVSLTLPIDDPMSSSQVSPSTDYKIVQLDLPVAF